MSVLRRLVVGVAVVVAGLAVTAPAASAHAVLLRTDPSPQTTVKSSPADVRLVFSESVEVSFGAIRVFDVDATRVDVGQIRRVQGNREVLVPVRHLKDGTYTVTWRVVSADGHPVHGGFSFYVGAPSTISARSVAEDVGAGRVVGWGFGVVRFAWFAALLGLVGAAVVRLWVWTPCVRELDLTESDAAEGFRHRFARAFPAMWVVLLVAGALSLVFETASVSGLSLLSSFRPSVLATTIHTAFGGYWVAEMVITALMLVPVAGLVRRRRLWHVSPHVWLALFAVGAAGLAVIAGLDSHARTLGHPALGVPSIAVHLAAVGVWVGGLASLVLLAGLGWRRLPVDQRGPLLRRLVPRFSRVAIVAVAVVVLTGTLNAILDLAKVSDLWSTTYGRVVLAKVVVLVLALGLAARHRFVTPKRLDDPAAAQAGARSFARTSAVELGLLALAVALASALVALVPGKTLALAANGPVNLERPAGAYTVQLFIDQTAVPNQVHVTFVNGQGLGAAEVANVTVSLTPSGQPSRPLESRLISPGHFVADTPALAAGDYRVDVRAGGGVEAATTFNVRLSKKGNP
ncbi:MAG: copper resistance protein CopC [Acidimicrobiales bacterium]|nr:copper resistance protein CopC [Acidimicrobiales bacterium]